MPVLQHINLTCLIKNTNNPKTFSLNQTIKFNESLVDQKKINKQLVIGSFTSDILIRQQLNFQHVSRFRCDFKPVV